MDDQARSVSKSKSVPVGGALAEWPVAVDRDGDAGLFEHIAEAPMDPILGTTQMFNADTDARKINLGVGAYRTEQGKPLVLDAVREAEEEMLKELGSAVDKEYSTIDGPQRLKTLTQGLLFGSGSEAVQSGRVASVQAPREPLPVFLDRANSDLILTRV